MRTFGNILWHVPFLGFIWAFATFLTGLILTITVILSPIGLGLIQRAKFMLAPFSYALVKKSDLGELAKPDMLWGFYSTLIAILYFPIGLVLFLSGVLQVVYLFTSLIGIPIGIVHAKSLGSYLNPVGKVCVTVEVEAAIRQRKAQETLAKYRAPAQVTQGT